MHPRYRRAAAVYDAALPVFSLGAAPWLHRTLASTVRSGTTVLDAGCGTGLMLPLLRAQVGPQGRVIGVDMTEPMIDRARARVAAHGWDNVELHRADMTDFDPGVPLDAAVFALSLSAAPPAEVFGATLARLRPGGAVAIADAIPARGRWYHHLSNLVLRLRAPLVGSDTERAASIARLAEELLVDVTTHVVWAGLYTVIVGRVPGAEEP